MMNNQRILIPVVVGIIIGGLLLYRAADRMYFSPRAEMIEELESITETVERYRSALDGRQEVQSRLQEYTDRTLGGDIETVDHRLRTRLSRIAEQIELQSISVTTSSPRALGSPARGMFRGGGMRELRDELDFIEVPGSITAVGTLVQVVELIDRIHTEPWLKQVYEVNLDPRDNGRWFSVRLRLRTVFLPGRPPDAVPNSPYEPDRLQRLASMTNMNPFQLPPAPEPEPEQETRVAERPPPLPFPFEQWVLTGVAEGTRGTEAWLRNHRTGDSKRIEAGEGLADYVLVAVRGEYAEFERDDERFLIAVGATLNDRMPLNR